MKRSPIIWAHYPVPCNQHIGVFKRLATKTSFSMGRIASLQHDFARCSMLDALESSETIKHFTFAKT